MMPKRIEALHAFVGTVPGGQHEGIIPIPGAYHGIDVLAIASSDTALATLRDSMPTVRRYHRTLSGIVLYRFTGREEYPELLQMTPETAPVGDVRVLTQLLACFIIQDGRETLPGAIVQMQGEAACGRPTVTEAYTPICGGDERRLLSLLGAPGAAQLWLHQPTPVRFTVREELERW